jgi:hypothetical protein
MYLEQYYPVVFIPETSRKLQSVESTERMALLNFLIRSVAVVSRVKVTHASLINLQVAPSLLVDEVLFAAVFRSSFAPAEFIYKQDLQKGALHTQPMCSYEA